MLKEKTVQKASDTFTELSDQEFQSYFLQGVSRTFALTIPQLPSPLSEVITNAYLLCRTVDTIEDEPALNSTQKRTFCDRFIQVVAGKEDSTAFSQELLPELSNGTLDAEKELVAYLPRVIQITHTYAPAQREALQRCVEIMSEGMAYYQEHTSGSGLKDLAAMDKYCYYVAGVVGEMLTDLFAYHSPKIAAKHTEMMSLAVSFGQGLQMTNILKDIWDDLERGACWLPREIFARHGYNLNDLAGENDREKFVNGLDHLLGIAHSHLSNALKYVSYIPAREHGIREFCLWAIGMAILTLRKIKQNPRFRDSQEVKISRNSVKATIVTTRIIRSNNFLLRLVFNTLGRSIPRKDISGN